MAKLIIIKKYHNEKFRKLRKQRYKYMNQASNFKIKNL